MLKLKLAKDKKMMLSLPIKTSSKSEMNPEEGDQVGPLVKCPNCQAGFLSLIAVNLANERMFVCKGSTVASCNNIQVS